MRIQSTSQQRASRSPSSLSLPQTVAAFLAAPGKIRAASIATAYIDIAALSAFLDHVASRADGRTGAEVNLFIERSSAMRLCADLRAMTADKQAKRLLKAFLSGILENVRLNVFSVQTTQLFHSKAFYLETNSHRLATIGSMNLTVNGFQRNEELVVSSLDMLGRNTQRSGFIAEIESYITKERLEKEVQGRVVPIKEILKGAPSAREVLDLRGVLLDGILWYERKEVEAFAFPLQLPDNFLKAQASFGETRIPHLTSKLDSALSVLPLFGQEFPKEAVERSRWRRRLCIPTCYGLWSPTEWRELIETGHKERTRTKHAHLRKIVDHFDSKQDEIVGQIVKACREIWGALTQTDLAGLATPSHSDLELRARRWVGRLTKKLQEPKYLEFLATGLSPINVPDVWSGNPSDALELETSFMDSLLFELSLPKPRSVLARRLIESHHAPFIEDEAHLRKVLVRHAKSLFRPADQTEDPAQGVDANI